MTPSTSHPGDSCLEVGIIGAGVSGLGVAYHLLQTAKRLDRNVAVILFEKNSTPGGTWSKDSVYPGLLTNNSWSQMIFDDENLIGQQIFATDERARAGPGGFRASGEGMSRVMEGIERQALELGARVQYGTEVLSVHRDEAQQKGWIVETSSVAGTDRSAQHFDKIVVASGAFSRPAVPAFALPLLQPLRQPILPENIAHPLVIHTSHLSEPTVQQALTSVPRKLVVVGASKSALDAAERFATLPGTPHEVTLVLRNPPYLAPPALPGPDGPADAVAMVGTRQKAIGVPYPSDPVSGAFASGGFWARWYRWLLHSSWLSSFYHKKIICASRAGFAKFGQWANPLMATMVPKVGLMWSESSIFPGSYKFAELVQEGRIKLVKGTVSAMDLAEQDGLKGIDVQVDNLEHIFATAIIFGTGWSTGEYPFFDDALLESLGLPVSYRNNLPEREEEYALRDRLSLEHVLSSLRTLRALPWQWSLPGFSARLSVGQARSWAPYRLFRLMVPLDSLYDRDIAFAGVPTCKANHVLFLCQAHWIADYFFDLLPRLPSKETAKEEVSTQTVWARRLFGPSHGRLGQWLGAMWIEYCSRLCWDMGVSDDGQGWTGVVTSTTYDLTRKRAERDAGRL